MYHILWGKRDSLLKTDATLCNCVWEWWWAAFFDYLYFFPSLFVPCNSFTLPSQNWRITPLTLLLLLFRKNEWIRNKNNYKPKHNCHQVTHRTLLWSPRSNRRGGGGLYVLKPTLKFPCVAPRTLEPLGTTSLSWNVRPLGKYLNPPPGCHSIINWKIWNVHLRPVLFSCFYFCMTACLSCRSS